MGIKAAVTTFLINSKSHVNILFITEVKILVLIKWLYRSS